MAALTVPFTHANKQPETREVYITFVDSSANNRPVGEPFVAYPYADAPIDARLATKILKHVREQEPDFLNEMLSNPVIGIVIEDKFFMLNALLPPTSTKRKDAHRTPNFSTFDFGFRDIPPCPSDGFSG